MKDYLIVANSMKDSNLKLAGEVAEYLEKRNSKVQVVRDADNIPQDLACEGAIILGGDGTMLYAASKLKKASVPMIGVNLGTMGYMAEIESEAVYPALDKLLLDEYEIEERLNLTGTIYHGDQPIMTDTALNDIVVSRSGYSRIISFRVTVNGELLDIYEADGVVVATPTGSTAYNLSAGGPIASPKTNLIVITPVSPHSLTSKSVIVSDTDRIEIELIPKRKSQTEEAMATFDGRGYQKLEPTDRITIEKSDSVTKIIKIHHNGFYELLRRKLGG